MASQFDETWGMVWFVQEDNCAHCRGSGNEKKNEIQKKYLFPVDKEDEANTI